MPKKDVVVIVCDDSIKSWDFYMRCIKQTKAETDQDHLNMLFVNSQTFESHIKGQYELRSVVRLDKKKEDYVEDLTHYIHEKPCLDSIVLKVLEISNKT